MIDFIDKYFNFLNERDNLTMERSDCKTFGLLLIIFIMHGVHVTCSYKKKNSHQDKH